MQLDKMDADLRRAAERTGDKYGEDFLGSYLSAPEDRRLSMLEGRFDSQEDLDGFLSDVELLENKEVSMGKMRAAANRKIVELIADTRRKNEEETANLEKEFQKIDAFEENGKRSVIEAFLDKYGGRDEVVFVSGAEELEGIFSPEEAEEIMSDIRRKGAYDHKNGKIYLFEPHFKDGVEAFRTLAHERLHWIADKIRQDPSFNGMLNRVLQIMGGGNALRQSLESEYANNNDLDLAEEYIARVCERVALKEVLDENGRSVFKTFKNWIKRIFTAENTAIDIHDREITDIAKALFNRVNRETQKLYSDDWTATTPEENGPEVGGKYAVLDASEIIASTDGGYDDTLQPRNRARRGSIEQVSKIAAHLNPKRLDSSETTDEGAPIIDAKGQVLSGNGRILAIREAYENNPERGASYRDYVLSRARQMGLNVPIGIKSPVLVRRIENSGGMSLQEFAARSNKQKVASMSNAETAVADARRILAIGTGGGRILDLFFPSDKGDVLSESNTEFINAFLEAVGGREQYIDKNGRIKANLAPRIRAAVLAAMLDPNKRDVIENLLDNPEGWSGLIRGLIGSAANLGKLAGNADYDLSSEMSQAVELYVNLRREGRTYKDYTSQLEMFEPAPSAEVSFLMELFEANVKTPTGISGVLNEYYSLVKNIDTSSVDMFGEGNPPKIAELQKAFERYGGTEHKSDVSWNIRKSDVERFESELQDYIDGKLDNKHVFRLGTTPEAMRLVGISALPIELKKSQLDKKLQEHPELNISDLKHLPVEIADPIAIFESDTVANAFVVLTEITAENGKPVVVAIHCDKEIASRKVVVNDIRSIHSRNISQLEFAIQNKRLRYINRKRIPSYLRLPLVQFHGRNLDKNLPSYGNKIFTEADLSQAEKDNIFELRQNNPRFRYSFRDTRSAPSDAEIAEAERQIEEVRARYVNTPQWLKAPNGKPTKLTEKQWLLVRTPNFKKWFGDWENDPKNASKVVDENGEPLVVYHGTTNTNSDYSRFTVFGKTDKGRRTSDGMHFFSSSRDVAGSMGSNVYDVFIFFRNPLVIDSAGNEFGAIRDHSGGIVKIKDLTPTQKKQLCKAFDFTPEELEQSYKPEDDIDLVQAGVIKRPEKSSNEWAKYAKENGYDGVIFKNLRDGADLVAMQTPSDVFVVFDSTQIKSATDNVGTYSENPDIRWSVRDDAKREADEWASNPENVKSAAEKYINSHTNENGRIEIDPDKIRAFVPNYDASNVSVYKEAGDKISAYVWQESLKIQTKNKTAILLTGNPAAGKSSASKAGLIKGINDVGILLDSPLNNFASVERRVEDAIKSGFEITIVQIYNDPVRSWKNSLKRGIEEGRFLPLDYFIGAYESANKKVEKIEIKLKSKYGKKINTIYIDSSSDIPKTVKTEDAKAWQYVVNENQFVRILESIYEYIENKYKSPSVGNNQSNEIAVITSGLRDSRFIDKRNSNKVRRLVGRILGRAYESSRPRLESEGLFGLGLNQDENPSNLKYLLRQERRENPLVWASIVLAKDILLGGRITQSKLEKLLPQSEGFDGSNYEYVKDRAVKVAETCRAKKYNAKKDLDQAVQLAESDYHWQSEMVDKIYSSFRKDGEEYGMAKAKVAQWLKDQKLKKLKDIKGYGESDFDADLTASILQAMEKEPANGFEGQSLSLEELEEAQPDGDSEMEVSEASRPVLNKNIRDVISTIKREVLRRSRLADESEGVMREKYRKTLVNILSASANELSYGLEKERILSKISELEKANYAVITIKDGERTGQKIDNFTLRAEHIALRIFNRGVRDDKAELGEKLDKILKSGGTFNKTKRADKRSISADSHEILNYARKVRGLSKEALDAEFDAVSNDLELSGKGYSSELKYNDALWKIEVLKKVGDWREKSRAQMAEAIEWFEKIKEKGIGDAQSLLERHNRENEKNRSVYEESLNAEKDKFRDDGKAPFSSYLNWAVHLADDLDYLASSSNPEAREKARAFSRELSREIYGAGSRRDNEIKRKIENITKILEEVYGEDAQKALKELFAYNDAFDKFSTQKVKMNKNRLLQLYASCKQNWYADNVLHFRAKNTKRGLELEKEIASLEERYANPEERAADWKGYKKTWREIEYIFGLNSVRVNAKALGLELDVGDKFYLKRPHKNYGLTWYYSAISTLVTIQSISSDGWISGVAPEFTNSGGSYPAYGFIWAVETAPFYLVVHAKNYPQRSLQVKIKKTTEFFSKVIHNHAPDIYDRFFPTTKSGIEAPEINNSTTPTFSLYQHWINSKKLIEAKPSIVREIYPGLWMRERYQTEAR